MEPDTVIALSGVPDVIPITHRRQRMYIVLYERVVCVDPACTDWRTCSIKCAKALEYEQFGKVTTVKGQATATLKRYLKQRGPRALNDRGLGSTGTALIHYFDTADTKPLWDDAQTAAFRVGGVEAVNRMDKALAAEERARERQRLREEKRHLKVTTKRVRSK